MWKNGRGKKDEAMVKDRERSEQLSIRDKDSRVVATDM